MAHCAVTHLFATVPVLFWGFMACIRSTSHNRNQRVLLPVNSRFPWHSITPTSQTHMTKRQLSFAELNPLKSQRNYQNVQVICTNLSFIRFPGHEARLCVNIPDANVSFTGGSEQQGVHVVAQSCEWRVTNLHWWLHLLHLHR